MTTSLLWDSMCKNGTNSLLIWVWGIKREEERGEEEISL